MTRSSSRVFTFNGVFSFIVILLIGGAIAYALNLGIKQMPIKSYFSESQTNAVWDWGNINNRSEQDLKNTAKFLYMHQINTVFVDIGGYADILKQANPRLKDEKTKELESDLQDYIKAMNKENINVLAAAGGTDWSKSDKQYIPLAIQQFVHTYNQNHEAKLSGIEFDIESYNQSHFESASMTEKGLVLTEFLDVADKLISRHKEFVESSKSSFELGFAIPYWFDNENQNIKSVEWKEKTGPTLYHLLDRLNELPASNVVVMAYRNAAQGNDGAIYHSRTEVEYANNKAPNVSVLIGMEVNNVEPEKITYFGRSYTELSSEASKISQEFRTNSKTSYGGVAINDLSGFETLKND